MNILDIINTLRNEKAPEEIENLLMAEKLGKIWTYSDGYQWIGNIQLSYLVVEIHSPGFIEWIESHPNKYVVHHEDGNKLNNVHENLQVMSRSEHTKMHDDEWYADPANAEAIKAMHEKMSAWWKDEANTKAIDTARKKMSKTHRKDWHWIDLSVFKQPFTIKEYAEASKVDYSIAWQRLVVLLSEGIITREKKQIGSKRWKNVYRRRLSSRF